MIFSKLKFNSSDEISLCEGNGRKRNSIPTNLITTVVRSYKNTCIFYDAGINSYRRKLFEFSLKKYSELVDIFYELAARLNDLWRKKFW
jgi:hypothetical protein